MAKRFTDTGKWDKGFFSNLTPEMKLAWLYLCDKCNHAGIWDINIKLLNFQTGLEIDVVNLQNAFGDKIFVKKNKMVILGFIPFQYGVLRETNIAHKSVISLIKNEKLESRLLGATLAPTLAPTLGDSIAPKDKDKDKDKDKEMDKDKEIKKNRQKNFLQEITKIYNEHYPLKKGKSRGLDVLSRDIKTPQDLENLILAIDSYKKSIKDPNFIKHFSTFAKEWRDWLDQNAGNTEIKELEADLSGIFSE